VYEAGPCSYESYRQLTKQGYDCIVVAPSLIPKKRGKRIENDRHDAAMLARLYRAGELTPVYVARIEDAAMRDLSRAREDANGAGGSSSRRLCCATDGNGTITASPSGALAHWRWLADIRMPHPAQQITLQEYVDAVRAASERGERFTEQLRQLVSDWRLGPVVEALQALRGVSLVVAVTTVAERGDLRRFDHPRPLMAYLGRVPSEHSSGESTQREAIPKTGNSHARRLLVEAAWSYRLLPWVSRKLRDRQPYLPQQVWEIAWKAQLRLCARYRRLVTQGKQVQVAVTAIARELAAFMWSIARTVSGAT